MGKCSSNMEIHLIQMLRGLFRFSILTYLNLVGLTTVYSQKQLQATCDALTRMASKASGRIGKCEQNEFCTQLQCHGLFVYKVGVVTYVRKATETTLTLNPCSMPTSAHLFAKAKDDHRPLIDTYIITNYRYDHPNGDFGYIRVNFEHIKGGIKIAIAQRTKADMSGEHVLVPSSEIPLACPEDLEIPEIKPRTVMPRTLPPLNIPSEHSKSNRLALQQSIQNIITESFAENTVTEISKPASQIYSKPTSNEGLFNYDYESPIDHDYIKSKYETAKYKQHSKHIETTTSSYDHGNFHQFHSNKHQTQKSNEEQNSVNHYGQYESFKRNNISSNFPKPSLSTHSTSSKSSNNFNIKFQSRTESLPSDVAKNTTTERHLDYQNNDPQTPTIETTEEHTSTSASNGYKTTSSAELLFNAYITNFLYKFTLK